jgi:uncharacterized damage-inducible protein DinB
MNINALLASEWDKEVANTRKMLERVPAEHFGWKPHEKSMSLSRLTVHLAEITGWPELMFGTDGLDFAATPYKPAEVAETADLLAIVDKFAPKSKAAMLEASEELLNSTWVMRMGEHIISKDSKYDNLRHTFGQMIHHRAQLGVYLRLLNVPIPGVYGPSADEMK